MSNELQVFTIPKADWEALMELSATAHRTPVILVGGLGGTDMAASARQRVQRKWQAVAQQQGFKVDSVEPHNEKARQVKAVPV